MRCDVLAIGTELLLGQITDTNSQWIGEQLAGAGIDSLFQAKVGDNLGRMTSLLRRMLDDADAVIVCGGLGPTHDDITSECIAAAFGVPWEAHPVAWERMERAFKPGEFNAARQRMATMPTAI